jgi:hypothetical protein
LRRIRIEREPGPDGVATAEPRSGLESPAGQGRALAHAHESAAAAIRIARRGPVVEDLDPELVGFPDQSDQRHRSLGVPERVGERLLDPFVLLGLALAGLAIAAAGAYLPAQRAARSRIAPVLQAE